MRQILKRENKLYGGLKLCKNPKHVIWGLVLLQSALVATTGHSTHSNN